MSVSTVSMRSHRRLFWLYRQQGRWNWCGGGGRFSALRTVVALFTPLTSPGPHVVHHFTKMHPQSAHHTHNAPAPVLLDCSVLFLWQHTPVVENGVALLPTLFPATELLVFPPPLWVSA